MKFGHGGPSRAGRLSLIIATWSATFALICMNALVSVCAEEINIRARITWGGGSAKNWQGRIWVEGGSVSGKKVLSLDSKTPGSIFIKGRQLFIQSRRETNYGAVDVNLAGDSSTRVFVEFASRGTNEIQAPVRNSILLSELVQSARGIPIDSQNNRVHLARVPGDQLRISTNRQSMVFRPGQEFEFSVASSHLTTTPSTDCKLRARLYSNDGKEKWSGEYDCISDSNGVLTVKQDIKVQVPLDGGAHNIQLDVYVPGNRYTFTSDRTVASRAIEFVVVPFGDAETFNSQNNQWSLNHEIDPTQANWWDTVQQHVPIGRFAGFSQPVMGNERSRITENDNGRWLEIDPGGWNAFPLSIQNPGEPHLLEIEFLAKQKLLAGISLVQKDRTNQIPAFGVDSGVAYEKPRYHGDTIEEPIKHKMLFWPDSNELFLLIANHDKSNKCLLGKIKIKVGPTRINNPGASVTKSETNNRKTWAYFESPLFPENFGAIPGVDAQFNQSIDDWQMFYDGADRFLQYLEHANTDGAIVTVACEGSAIYPSQVMEPTPKYDSGQFFTDGRDIVRKDVLNMMFEMFDRESKTLVPAIELSSPIPALERIRREFPDRAVGLDLYHIHGHLLENDPNYSSHLSVSYNPLHPDVQQAIANIANELLEKYGHHKSFGGIAIKCGQNSFVTLPSQLWGYDLATVNRFVSETGTQPPADIDLNTASMKQLATWLLREHRATWLNWRSRKISMMFHRIGDMVKTVNPNAKLFITGVDMYQGDEARLAISPSLRWSPDFNAFKLQMGINHAEISSHPQIEWIEGNTDLPGWTLSESRIAEQVSKSNAARAFAKSTRGGELNVSRILWSEFDQLPGTSSTNNSNSVVRAQILAQGAFKQRQFFAQRLALSDTNLFVQGGRLLPIGQESALEKWMQVYKQLPAGRFDEVKPEDSQTSCDSLVVRHQVIGQRRYFYAVNQSPWPVSAELHFVNQTGHFNIESLGSEQFLPRRQTNRATVPIELEPFGLVGGFTDKTVEIIKWTEQTSPEIRSQLWAKSERMLALIQKAHRVPALEQIGNTEFEMETATRQPAQWNVGRQASDRVAIDSSDGYQSKSCLKITSDGTPTWIRSEPFAPPVTGRISIAVWLRTKPGASQPALRLAIEARHFGKEYYRFGDVGKQARAKEASPLSDRWQKYIVHFDDIPSEGLSQMQIGFDLMSEGEVWVDHVEVFDRWLDEDDVQSLTQQVARVKLIYIENGKLETTRQILDSYWFEFLETYLGQANQLETDTQPLEPEASSARLIDRVRGIVPRRFFRFR